MLSLAMNRILDIAAPEALDALRHSAVGDLLPAYVYKRDAANAHFVYLDDHDAVLARASVWTNATLSHEGQRVGAIGHYAAQDAVAARVLLARCTSRIGAEGCPLAVGPMDGSTWRTYRLITMRGDEPPFFLEPDDPDEYPEHFTSAGFFEVADYVSTLNDDLSRTDPRLGELEAKFQDLGVVVRPFDPSRTSRELDLVYDVSQAAFRGGFLYTPIERQDFRELYLPICNVVEPSLVLLAEHAGRPVGFIFGVGDLNQKSRGEPIDTLIVKSLAILPDRRYAGLGTVLLDRCQQAARKLGLCRAIHALMHAGNDRVVRLSSRYGRPFRRYALFAKKLP
jgi:GNAT superfamily N-acetyltransferase